MKLVLESIQVTGAGHPATFCWRQRTYRIDAISECWAYRGKWWFDPVNLEGDSRVYYRVHCSRNASGRWARASDGQMQQDIFEIYRQGSQWILSRVWD